MILATPKAQQKSLSSIHLIKRARRLAQEISGIEHQPIRTFSSLMVRQRAEVEKGIVGGGS